MRHAFRLAAVSFCLIGLGGASALADDDAELERIRLAIATAIAPAPDSMGPQVVLAAPVVAAWRDGRAVVSLKGAKLAAPDDVTFVIGDVDIAVLPRGDGFYDFDVAMPTSFDVIAEDGTPEGKISIGHYRLAGTWSREVGSLTNLDAAFDNVSAKELVPGRDNFNATLSALEARMNYTKGASGLWSGTANARIAGLRIIAEAGSEDVAIASIEAKSSTSGSDWAAWQRVMDKLEAITAPGAPPPSEEARHAFAQDIRTINWGTNDGTLSIKGLSVTSSGERLFTLGNTTWKLALDGSKEAGPLSLRFAVGDLLVEENTLPPNLAPTKGALDISFDQFPVRAFFGSMLEQVIDEMMVSPAGSAVPPVESEPLDDAGTQPTEVPADEAPVAADGSAEEAAPGAEPEAVPPEAEMEPPPSETQEPPMMGPFPADDLFLQQLFALGTVFALNELSIDAPGTGVSASGRLRVDPEAMGMGTGNITATVRGIDAVLAYVNAEAKTDDEMKDIASFLIFLKGLGKAEGGSGGETVYVYDIDVPKDGPPTVNGTDIDAMME